MSLFFLISLLFSFSSCAVSQEDFVQTRESFKGIQTNSQENIMTKQDDKILSRDFSVAEKALKQAIEQKDKEAIRKGLKNQDLLLGQKTSDAIIKAIIEMKDITFVPNLIEALQQNRSIIAGGGEIVFLQRDLDKMLVNALNKLTRLDFKVSNHSLGNVNEYAKHIEEINEIIKQSLEWVKTHKAEIKRAAKLES